jgi:hypothetical protein
MTATPDFGKAGRSMQATLLVFLGAGVGGVVRIATT